MLQRRICARVLCCDGRLRHSGRVYGLYSIMTAAKSECMDWALACWDATSRRRRHRRIVDDAHTRTARHSEYLGSLLERRSVGAPQSLSTLHMQADYLVSELYHSSTQIGCSSWPPQPLTYCTEQTHSSNSACDFWSMARSKWLPSQSSRCGHRMYRACASMGISMKD